MKEQKITLLCEDSGAGIFSAIYIAYEKKLKPENTTIETLSSDNYTLFTEYMEIKTDSEKAKKVENTIYRKFGGLTAYYIWCCIYSHHKEKADIIYHTIARGLANDLSRNLINYLQDPYIMKLSKIQKNVSNEAHHFKGFLHFTELENGILFGKISPKNQVLPLLVHHFADRFGGERFIIYDECHKVSLFHEAGEETILYYPTLEEREQLEYGEMSLSQDEIQRRELFKIFHRTIAIKSRENKKLQKNLLPLRFRGNMIEF